jgi:hypothetical protein
MNLHTVVRHELNFSDRSEHNLCSDMTDNAAATAHVDAVLCEHCVG